MNVRAYFPDTREYLHPRDDVSISRNESLIEFYSFLEGYRLKGRDYIIDYGSGIKDIAETEIFQNDKVDIYFFDDKAESIDDCEVEEGDVLFEYGCFVVQNKEGLVFDLANFFIDEEKFLIAIKPARYEKEEEEG